MFKRKIMDIVNYGNKIKDIEINKKHYLIQTLIFLVIFNLMLACSLVYASLCIKAWYITTFSVLIFVGCIVWSVFTFLKAKNIKKYELYENVLVVNSLWKNALIDLSKVIKIQSKNYKHSSDFKTVTFTLQSVYPQKISLHFVKEDVENLINEITNLVNKTK